MASFTTHPSGILNPEMHYGVYVGPPPLEAHNRPEAQDAFRRSLRITFALVFTVIHGISFSHFLRKSACETKNLTIPVLSWIHLFGSLENGTPPSNLFSM